MIQIYCSFCKKNDDQVEKMIVNPYEDFPRVYICNECVETCAQIILDDKSKKPVLQLILENTESLIRNAENELRAMINKRDELVKRIETLG